jgi:hypothetical protein
MMGTQTITFDKPAHKPGPMTSTLGDDDWILTCLELSCENSVKTACFQQHCTGECHGNVVVVACAENLEGEWEKL